MNLVRTAPMSPARTDLIAEIDSKIAFLRNLSETAFINRTNSPVEAEYYQATVIAIADLEFQKYHLKK